MKVIFSLPSIPRYLARFEMLKHLAGKVDRLSVITAEGLPSYPNMPENMDVLYLPGTKLRFLGGLAARSGFSRVDVVHDTFGYLIPLGFAAKLLPSKRYVTSVYGSAAGWLRKAGEIGYDNAPEIRGQKKLKARENLNSRLADFIMVNSADFIRDYSEAYGCPPRKMAVVPNSITVDASVEYSEKAGNGLKLLCVGRLSRMKGTDLLLEAHQELVSEGHDIHLTFIGRPISYDLPYLNSKAWQNVTFIPEKPHKEIQKSYHQADVCIHPSAQEGMPRVVMEALSYGTPVIASNLAGIRSIDGSGEYIRLMERYDRDSLKQLILEEIRSPRKSKSFFDRSRTHMQTFSPERTASAIYENYKKLF